MPVVTHHRALILPSSPPTSPRGVKPLDVTVTAPADLFPVHHHHHHHPLLVPYELVNGCTEEDCVIESDNALLTNAVRKHFLLHFGHRDSHAMLHDYAPDAVLVHVLNGTRSSFHGHSSIRNFIHDMLQQHPTINSSFSLRNIRIMDMGSSYRQGDVVRPDAHPTLFHRMGTSFTLTVTAKLSSTSGLVTCNTWRRRGTLRMNKKKRRRQQQQN
jgi:hypothetical protein